MPDELRFWECECGKAHRLDAETCEDCGQVREDGAALTDENDIKRAVLAEYLECEFSEVDECSYEDGRFEACGSDYLVLTDEEADKKAKERILDELWAFNASFIISHSKLPYEAEEMIQAFQESKCEDANETIKALIEDEDEFVSDAVGADGRGHFLSGYDGNENEYEDYFIYRD